MPDLKAHQLGEFFNGKDDSWVEDMAKPLCKAHWRHPDFYLNVGDPNHPEPCWRKPIEEAEYVCFEAEEGCSAVLENITMCYFRVIAFKHGGKTIDKKATYTWEATEKERAVGAARKAMFEKALTLAKKLLSSIQNPPKEQTT
jgi:hypothetical protein